MSREFVRVLCNVECDWEGLHPIYRVYVNDELFTERTWRWTDEHLEEMIPIEAEPGEYTISYELVPPHLATIHVQNMRVDHGPGTIEGNKLRIYHAS